LYLTPTLNLYELLDKLTAYGSDVLLYLFLLGKQS
jgi:hypothetical protein